MTAGLGRCQAVMLFGNSRDLGRSGCQFGGGACPLAGTGPARPRSSDDWNAVARWLRFVQQGSARALAASGLGRGRVRGEPSRGGRAGPGRHGDAAVSLHSSSTMTYSLPDRSASDDSADPSDRRRLFLQRTRPWGFSLSEHRSRLPRPRPLARRRRFVRQGRRSPRVQWAVRAHTTAQASLANV
jgi:hypothetical protein